MQFERLRIKWGKMSITQKQLDDVAKLISAMPPIRQIDPSYSALESQIRTFIRTAEPRIKTQAVATQKTFGPGNQASAGEIIVTAIVTSIVVGVVTITMEPASVGSEAQRMQQGSIRAIAKQALNQAAAKI